MIFLFLSSALWYQYKTQGEEEWNSEGTNSNHKWRKTELSDLSPIRPTDEQFVIGTGLTVHPTLL